MKDLLDVNVLLALAWPNHISHKAAHNWIQSRTLKGFVTCPLTEAGFIRLSLNPSVVSEIVSLETVLSILEAFKSLSGHEFWADSLEAKDVFKNSKVTLGHRQITDSWLLALAEKNNGRLVSFDKKITSLVKKYSSKSLLILD